MTSPIVQCQLCFVRWLCKEKLLLSCQNSFIRYCKIVKHNIFELGIFSFNSYVYYLTRDFIASTRAFYPPTCAFNLATRAFSLLTRGFELVTRRFKLVTRVLLFHSLVLLTTACFHRRLVNFALSRYTDKDWILVHNF